MAYPCKKMRHFLYIICYFWMSDALAQNIKVYIALDTECPMSQKYVRTIQNIKNDFPNVTITGVFTPWESDSTIIAFRQNYHLDIPYVIDNNYQLLRQLDAKIVPEAFVIQDNVIEYSGSIDNWYYDLGKYRSHPTELYLYDAINALLAQRCVAIPRTTAQGCIIEY